MANENVEVFEIWLNDEKIDELIEKLNQLKEDKEHVHFEDKKRNQILLVHEETQIL